MHNHNIICSPPPISFPHQLSFTYAHQSLFYTLRGKTTANNNNDAVNLYIPPGLDTLTQRRLSLNLGNGACKWSPPNYTVPPDLDFHKTVIAGFPSGDKRMIFTQMEALTNASYVENECEKITSQGDSVSAFIMEGGMSVAGVILPPKSYMRQCVDSVHNAGGLYIADEVQTGFGRLGKCMWAFQYSNDGESSDIIPDIVTGEYIGRILFHYRVNL